MLAGLGGPGSLDEQEARDLGGAAATATRESPDHPNEDRAIQHRGPGSAPQGATESGWILCTYVRLVIHRFIREDLLSVCCSAEPLRHGSVFGWLMWLFCDCNVGTAAATLRHEATCWRTDGGEVWSLRVAANCVRALRECLLHLLLAACLFSPPLLPRCTSLSCEIS